MDKCVKRGYLIVGIAVLAILIVFGFLSYNKYQAGTNRYDNKEDYLSGSQYKSNGSNFSNNSNNQRNQPSISDYPETKGCKGTGSVKLSVSPRKMEDIGYFAPMGLMLGDHVTPIDHGYFHPPIRKMDVTSAELKDVYVPADGVITLIARMPDFFKTTNQADLQDYRIIIYHSCTFYTIYIHVNTLSDKLMQAVPNIQPGNNKYVSINVKAGELLGRGNSIDFSVVDNEKKLTGYLDPKNYEGEPWKIHIVDPIEAFAEPVRSQLIAKNPRSASPIGGKIDYDQPRKLIGNWFLEGTRGYAGVETQMNYWTSHIAFAPDAYDPSHFIISLGEFDERSSRQYGVKGNSPDPASVDSSSGLIKYELVQFDYIDSSGNAWDGLTYGSGIKVRNLDSEARGILLVQVLEGEKLKVEKFPGKTANEVNAFTNNAKMYYR